MYGSKDDEAKTNTKITFVFDVGDNRDHELNEHLAQAMQSCIYSGKNQVGVIFTTKDPIVDNFKETKLNMKSIQSLFLFVRELAKVNGYKAGSFIRQILKTKGPLSKKNIEFTWK